jgi:hypothetical protein
MAKKATELPNIMSLPSHAPPERRGTVPHWKVWRWAKAHVGQSWKR